MRLTLSLAAALALAIPPAQSDDAPSALVATQPLANHELVETVTGFGAVSGQPGHVFNLSLPAAGRVDAMLVSVGQAVRKDQPLLRVRTDASASQAYAQADNALTFARRDLERQKLLLARQLATNAQVDAAQHTVRDAEQALAAQKALGAGAAIATVRAPVTGVVTSLAVSLGDRPAAGATLGQMVAGNALQVRVGLLPEEARQVRAGMKVHLSAIFDPGQAADGVVDGVSSQVDPVSQRVDVVVRLSGALPHGSRVKGVITLARQRALAVPRQAVLRDDEGSYVYQVLNGHAHRVSISTGGESEGLIAIHGALTANAPVVVLGNYELADGVAVREGMP